MASSIGKAVTVKGSIQGAEAVEISGTVVGDVVAANDLITIETAGRVDGVVTAREIVVRGTSNGRLVATEVVRLESGSQVNSDIASPKLSVEDGALFNGRVDPGRAEAAARVAAYRQG
jgi:cytoskeletal protein CcmA (bactofilin family)